MAILVEEGMHGEKDILLCKYNYTGTHTVQSYTICKSQLVTACVAPHPSHPQ